MNSESEYSAEAVEVAALLGKFMNGALPDFHIKSRPDGNYLILEVANPNSTYFANLNIINEGLDAEHPFKDKVVLQERKKKPISVLDMPEVSMLRAELVQSLTVHRNSFKTDFYNRYIPSVSDFEAIIVTDANFVVYGRRGAGKSSLLAYAMHKLIDDGASVAWLAMQTYSSRNDTQAICSILSELFSEILKVTSSSLEISEFEEMLGRMGEEESEDLERRLLRIIPRMRKTLGSLTGSGKALTVFIDDLHLLHPALQPRLLATIYSLARGNNIYIKISGIEPLTRLWDGASSTGLQSPGDIQEMKLDYNLTIPDRSGAHIKHILDSHAQYCGLPSVQYIVEGAAISRLVLSAAAVPRDALSLFAQAIHKSSLKRQKLVSITSINAAASESIESKLRDLELDAGNEKNALGTVLERIKAFCITQQRTNAFLVKIDNSSKGYALVQKLAALRFAHVLHEGITPHKAGERYIALMLDFGFYVGIRAARSVELFLDEPKDILAKDLRKLPIFNPDDFA